MSLKNRYRMHKHNTDYAPSAGWNQCSLEYHEYGQGLSEIDEAVDRQIPRFFRIGALVPIWGYLSPFSQISPSTSASVKILASHSNISSQ
ncbi:MAG: hypothetical protein IPM73_07420 [Betaproteobacteria bacterium]|nr:hypothetical protein [Betaproteobacteria bacterium]